MDFLRNIVFPWILSNLAWELPSALLWLGVMRINKWVNGTDLDKKKEWAFWSFGTIGITTLLVLVNAGVITPIKQRLFDPSFSADVVQMSLADESATKHQATFTLTIYNEGAPSVVRGWRLKISGPDHPDMFPPRAVFPLGKIKVIDREGVESELDKKDSFIEDAGNSPIERGAKRTGFVSFVVDGASREYLQAHSTKYDLAFWDIKGKEYWYRNLSMPPPQ